MPTKTKKPISVKETKMLPGTHLYKSVTPSLGTTFYFTTVKNGQIITKSSEGDNYPNRQKAIKAIIADIVAKDIWLMDLEITTKNSMGRKLADFRITILDHTKSDDGRPQPLVISHKKPIRK